MSAESTTDYTNESQQRILKLIVLLKGHEIVGMAPADIARQQGCAASAVTRDLANLRTAGFAELVPETGLWRLTPAVVSDIGLRFLAAVDRAERRLAETKNRYSRSS